MREFTPRCGRDPKEIEIRTIGQRPGEKLYEELMNEEETRRSWELERYYVVRPALVRPNDDISLYEAREPAPVGRPYNSSNVQPLSPVELTAFLYENGLLDDKEASSRSG